MPATGSDSENENYFLWRSAGDELKSLTAGGQKPAGMAVAASEVAESSRMAGL